MKILYLSCHTVLAYDECKLLQELGHEIWCPGSFVEELNKGDDSIRPQLVTPSDQIEWHRDNMSLFHACGIPGKDNKENLSVELLKRFDVVIIMHLPIWVKANWVRFKEAGVRVILREIGQSWRHNEEELASYARDGLKIVRYSPREELIPNKNQTDALIRFYKDPEEFFGWTGENQEVVSFCQSMPKREGPCNFKWLEEATRPFNRKLYGTDSEAYSWGNGKVPFAELKLVMRESRVYANSGTYPASVTLSAIESWITGTPLVCVGPALGHPFPWFKEHPLYEWGDLIENGVNGFCSDDMGATHDFIRQCLNDYSFANEVGRAGRLKAVEVFGREKISGEWERFLNSL